MVVLWFFIRVFPKPKQKYSSDAKFDIIPFFGMQSGDFFSLRLIPNYHSNHSESDYEGSFVHGLTREIRFVLDKFFDELNGSSFT